MQECSTLTLQKITEGSRGGSSPPGPAESLSVAFVALDEAFLYQPQLKVK
jgi:hypothetical protein